MARLRDQHDLLRGDPLAAVRGVPLRAPQHPRATRPVPGMRVSDRHKQCLHRVRRDGEDSESMKRNRKRTLLAILLLFGSVLLWGVFHLWGFAIRGGLTRAPTAASVSVSVVSVEVSSHPFVVNFR